MLFEMIRESLEVLFLCMRCRCPARINQQHARGDWQNESSAHVDQCSLTRCQSCLFCTLVFLVSAWMVCFLVSDEAPFPSRLSLPCPVDEKKTLWKQDKQEYKATFVALQAWQKRTEMSDLVFPL